MSIPKLDPNHSLAFVLYIFNVSSRDRRVVFSSEKHVNIYMDTFHSRFSHIFISSSATFHTLGVICDFHYLVVWNENEEFFMFATLTLVNMLSSFSSSYFFFAELDKSEFGVIHVLNVNKRLMYRTYTTYGWNTKLCARRRVEPKRTIRFRCHSTFTLGKV